jgi:hypothetical protein
MGDKPQARLSALLRQAREIHRLSVRGAAARARISGTYLSQIEADLLRAAGYVVPESGARPDEPTASPLDVALRTSAPLTDDEREALAEYLAWYRSRRGHAPGRP